jgi:phenylacetate-CoA ligase
LLEIVDLETLYARFPIPIQNSIVSLEGARIAYSRYGANFQSLLSDYERRTSWDQEKIREYRDQRLSAIVHYSACKVPYWRDRFTELSIDPRDIKRLADLESLPVTDKYAVREAPERFTSESAGDHKTTIAHTSGSTGAGLRFPLTWDAHREQYAVWWRYRRWHGIELNMPCLYFGGRSIVPPAQRTPPYWRYNKAGHQILFSGYHLGRQTVDDYFSEMKRSGAQWLHGYPSLVALLAGFALERGFRPNIRWVTLGGENLLPQQAQLIEHAFGVPALNHYGMAEGVANISQCPAGAMHIDEDFAAVELVPRGGDQYDVVGTALANFAFPLIRYVVGDVVTLSEGSCGCGRPGRIVERIDGRQEDYVVTRTGALLGRLDHIFKDMLNIKEAQIRQDQPGQMDVCVVKSPGYSEEDENRLKAETLKRVGKEVAFTIRYVEGLEHTASGKLRFVVSSLDQGRLLRKSAVACKHPDRAASDSSTSISTP